MAGKGPWALTLRGHLLVEAFFPGRFVEMSFELLPGLPDVGQGGLRHHGLKQCLDQLAQQAPRTGAGQAA